MTGETPAAALEDLSDRLRGVSRPDGGRMEAMRARVRLAYVAGAEEWAAANLGRRLRRDELGRVIGRYTGR